MALKINNYVLKGDEELEFAYAKINNVLVQNTDYEFYENNPNYENDGIEQFLRYIKRVEATATVFVYADEIARNNNAHPLDWFTFKFDYDINSTANPFEQGYKHLQIRYPNCEGN
jgi:hypothetical protein